MNTHENHPSDPVDLKKGLPMFTSANTQALEKEKEVLRSVENKGLLTRWKTYLGFTGPGWMQSAMTLGASSASASLFAGAFCGYKLLWVQPVAMLLGIIMMQAIVHQTLSTGCRPYDAMRQYIHPAYAWLWAILSLLVTVIWHIPQYALAAGTTTDMFKALSGWKPASTGQETVALLIAGGLILILSIYLTWGYGNRSKGVRLYEKILKGFLWLIIGSFILVAVNGFIQGKINIKELCLGMVPNIPASSDPVFQKKIYSLIISGFAGAVGLNMTFLFPYTLLARGWGRQHRALGSFDLFTGMLIPYSLATGLMIIATACTLHGTPEIGPIIAGDKPLSPILAASMLEKAGLNHYVARVVFGMGILGMVMTTITMQMLVAGFAVCEMFKVEPGGKLYRLACLIPTPAFLGVLFWQKISFWIAVPTAAVCGIMLPVAYIGFFLLNNNTRYLKADKPAGVKGFCWNIGMIIAIIVSIAAAIFYIYDIVIPFINKITHSWRLP